MEVELNGIGDNPMVLIERDTLISNGNFQPMQLALAFDALRTGAAHVAMISERRMNKLTTIRFSDPALMLAGLSDEEMPRRALVHYAAASLLAELKHLAAPVSIHLPPLDLDVEDHGAVTPSVVFTTRRALDAARHDPDLRGADGDRPDGRPGRAGPRQRNAGGLRERAGRLVEAPRGRRPGRSRRGDASGAALTRTDPGPCSRYNLYEASTSACSGRHESVTREPTPGRVPPLASSVFCVTAIMRAPGAISTT